MMSLLGCIQALFEGFSLKKADTCPIGLKAFQEPSDDELLNELSRPITTMPKLQVSFSRKSLLKSPPAFAHIPQTSYGPHSYQNFRTYRQYSQR